MTRLKASRLFVFAFSTLLGPACEGDAVVNQVTQPTTGRIVGRVMVGSSPRSGAVVTVREQARLTVVATRITDSNGSYAVDGLMPGAHRVSIEASPGVVCAPADRSVVVVEGNAIEVSFSCVGGASASIWLSVVGQVIVNFKGEPGIAVRLSDEDGSIVTTTTDADGRYAFSGFHVSTGVLNVTIETPVGATCPSTNVRWHEIDFRSHRTANFFCSRPNDRPVSSVALSPDSLTVGVYDVARLTVVVRDMSGGVIVNPEVTFLVSGLAEGTVDPTGFVRGLPGQCSDGTVVARSGGVDSNPIALRIGSPSGAGCWDY